MHYYFREIPQKSSTIFGIQFDPLKMAPIFWPLGVPTMSLIPGSIQICLFCVVLFLSFDDSFNNIILDDLMT